jgi:hypothetical protein
MKRHYVTASELAEYFYCECCWIDSLEGLKIRTFAMEKGAREHEAIQGKYLMLLMLRRTAVVLVIISLIAVIVFSVFTFLF